MDAKKNPKPTAKEQANNTLGIEDLSTHPNSPSKRKNTDLPIEFGRYRLLKVLGEGGMGAVYLAHDTELDRKVALKLPHFVGGKSKDQGERFRREARLAATLDHANICRIHDIGELHGRLFLTMQYVEGKTLNDIIKAKGAIEPRTAVNLVKRIASAVQVAHAQGIIHRDLKPANIMIKKDRDFVIMDFGLARRVEQEEVQLTATGAVLGTPAYMAPEQLRGENNAVGPQSDVYSLGIILYELLTGQRPFQGTLPQIYAQVLSTDSVFPSSVKTGLDSALDEICRKATSAKTNERYRTAEEFAKSLGGYLAGQSQATVDALAAVPAIAAIGAPFASYQPTIKKPQSVLTTHRKQVAIGAIVGLAALVLLGAFLFPRSSTRTVDDSLGENEVTTAATATPAQTAPTNTSFPAASNGQSSLASTTESPNGTSGQVQENKSKATPAQNDSKQPGLVWSSPPGKIWFWCASYSPKGTYVAASALDRENPKPEFATIRVWPIRDDQTGNDSFVLRHPTPNNPELDSWVSGMSFSPDGRRLASATQSGSLALWDMESTTPSLLSNFARFSDVICGVAFSPDGRYFAAGARKAGSPVIVWDISNPKEPKEAFQLTPPSPNETCSLVFSKDSQTLYIGAGAKGIDGNLFAWQFTKSKEASLLWKNPPSEGRLWVRACLSEDGSRMAVIHGDKCYAIDSNTGKQIGVFSGHEKSVIGIQWLGNSDICISASYDHTIRVWNVLDGEETWRNDTYMGSNEGLSVSQDGRFAVSSSKDQLNEGNVVQFWRLPSDKLNSLGNNNRNATPSLPTKQGGLNEAPAGFRSLFNGKDLKGWHGRKQMDPRKWNAESDAAKSHWKSEMLANWTIKDSVLSNKVKSVDLSTDDEFGDVELMLEYKLSPKADAGVYLRGSPQVQIWDHTDKDKLMIGAGKGSGGLYNNSPGAAGKEPSVLADKPLGEWNSMRIVQIGNRTSVWLNDQQVVDRCVMENFWEKTQPLFSKGVIQLQSFEGAEVQWRNIFVREIPKTEGTAAFLTESPNNESSSRKSMHKKDGDFVYQDMQTVLVLPGAADTKLPGKGKKIVLISGDEEYRSEETMPMLGKILSEQHGYDCVVLFSINPETNSVDPNYLSNIPGLNHLDDANGMIMCLRFRALPDHQMAHFNKFMMSGKPFVALRTSTHAFNFPVDSKSAYKKWSYNSKEWEGGFGQQIIGETWHSHHGVHGSQATRGVIVEAVKTLPILKGVSDVFGPSDVYGIVHLPSTANVLLQGQVLAGMNPTDPPLEGPKNSPMMPLAWTKDYQMPGGKTGKLFCTTMGAANDLLCEDLRRLVVNATYWMTGLENKIPTKASVNLSENYKPDNFGHKPSNYFAEKHIKPIDLLK